MHGKYHHFFGYVNGAFIHLRSWLGLKVERLSGEGDTVESMMKVLNFNLSLYLKVFNNPNKRCNM